MGDVAATRLASGDQVEVRGDRWTVTRTITYTDCRALYLDGCGRTNRGVSRTLLVPFDRPRRCREEISGVKFVPPKRWTHRLRQHLLSTHPYAGMNALVSAAVHLLPFQLEPALSMLRHGRLRLLIADEVGLGKTVQAGIVIAQLRSDQPDSRVLVVTPAGLREQWRHELLARFSLTTISADTAWLSSATRDLPPDVNPWSLQGVYVASVDFVKRPEVLRALESIAWDALVVDEAHNLTPATARLVAVDALASRARRSILLTATPPDGDEAHMNALLSIGRLADHDQVTIFRRSRTDVGLEHERKSVLLPVRLSVAERTLHGLLERYTSHLWCEAGSDERSGARLLATVLRKRALSSPGSLDYSVLRRIALLDGRNTAGSAQLPLPLDEDPLPDEVSDDLLGAPGLVDQAGEREMLEHISAAAASAAPGSKLRYLQRLLARIREPVIVFTEYRDTLGQIASSLAHRAPLLLHGGMSIAERQEVSRAFGTSGSILLATDAASEGLNLHHRCRVVVHFELPWTPMRLEQRTGRVDRLGQGRRVHEVLLVARHTAERLVLAPLLMRARIAASAGGRSRFASMSDASVAQLILGGREIQAEEAEVYRHPVERSHVEGAREEADRLARHRRLSRPPNRHHSPGVVVTLDHRSASGVVAVIRVALLDAEGHLVASVLVPVSLGVPCDGLAWTPAKAKDTAHALLRRDGVRVAAAAREHVSGQLVTWMAQHRAVLESLAAREAGIRRQHANGAARPVQAGLFDRRALAAAERRWRAAAIVLDELDHRDTFLRAHTSLQTSVQPVAVRIGAPRRT